VVLNSPILILEFEKGSVLWAVTLPDTLVCIPSGNGFSQLNNERKNIEKNK